MYNIRAAHWAPCQLLTGYVYRVDTRTPSQVAQEGFQGTHSTAHRFAAFERDTVFASLTARGALIFQGIVESAGRELPLYLYKIKVDGLRGYVFRSRHTGSNAFRHAEQLAHVRFEYKQTFYRAKRTYQQLGEARFINDLAHTLAYHFQQAFVRVNEVHVQGPIAASRITPYFAYSDDMLPAPVAALAPRARRNSI